MKTDNTDRSLIESGSVASATFGLSESADDMTHLMAILRSNLYSDKILAVLREYGANAWDANRMVGNGQKPISVHLPTSDDPTLRIRDFGPGLSEADVLNVYTKYGKSTKRDTNDAVGSLGIGSKSGFAYSESFTITSWFGGVKSIYFAVLDKTNRGKMDKVFSEPSEEPNGLEISLGVRPGDISSFESRALRLFPHFSPRPEINTELPPIPAETVALSSGSISPKDEDEDDQSSTWVAVMGCVPYKIDLSEIPADRFNKCLYKMNGTLNFPIGAVDFAASREHLEYTDRTKLALADQFDALIDEYVLQALTLMDSTAISAWEKRMRLYVLNGLDIEIPKEYESFHGHRVQIIDPLVPEPFTITHNKAAVGSVTVSPKLRFVLDDTRKSLKNYELTVDDYVVRPTGRAKLEDVEARIGAILGATNLLGVPVVRLSTITYTPRAARASSAPKNAKHKQTLFVFNPHARHFYSRPYSKYWEGVTRVPEADDVFIVLHDFRDGRKVFFRDYERDEKLCLSFGVTMPLIYGYKSTEKKPVLSTTCVGTEYSVWREGIVKHLLTPENLEKITAYFTAQNGSRVTGYMYSDIDGRRINGIAMNLGEDHAITSFFREFMAAKKITAANRAIDDLAERAARDGSLVEVQRNPDQFTGLLASLKRTYPLLDGLACLVRGYDETSWKDWIRYIKLVDSDNQRIQDEAEIKAQAQVQGKQESNDRTDSVHAN